MQNSLKSRSALLWLTFLLGAFGAHKFYLGQKRLGLLYLVFFWTFIPGIIALIEWVYMLTLNQAAFNAKYNYVEIMDADAASISASKSKATRAALVTAIVLLSFIAIVLIFGGKVESKDTNQLESAAPQSTAILEEKTQEQLNAEKVDAIIPKCDSSDAKNAAISALQEAPGAEANGFKVFKIEKAQEYAHDWVDISRMCFGSALTNGGSIYVLYTFTRTEDKQDVMIEVREIPYMIYETMKQGADSGQAQRDLDKMKQQE